MYDFIFRRKRVVQLILALITLPFAFFAWIIPQWK
jgi:hypothetical protein